MIARSPYLSPRRLLALCVLLAIALRSLIPLGYMPDFSGEGRGLLPLMFCDGMDHGAMDPAMKMDGMDASAMVKMHHHHDHTGTHGLCPFGASALFEFSGLGLPFILTLITVAIAVLHVKAWDWQGRIAFSNYRPRSPPAV